jgi:Bacterial CdiA-CT RNAse A domain
MTGFRIPGATGALAGDWGVMPPLIDEGTMCRAATPPPGPLVWASKPPTLPQPDAMPDEQGGIQIVLTPVQLAAVLEGDSLESPSPTITRMWGAVGLLGGALELLGAGALLAVPEPTLTTKVAGGVLGAHGLDTAGANLRQIVSGQSQSTVTAQASRSAAELLGADPNTAAKIGVGVDLAVPLLAGVVGALRVLAIRRGALSLVAEEAAGGHAIARHVGRTEAQLQARLVSQPRITAASSFRTLADAERAVSEALKANRAAIKAWAKTAKAGQTQPFHHDAGRVVGEGVVRGSGVGLQPMSKVTLVLRRVVQDDRVYFVLSAFPKL